MREGILKVVKVLGRGTVAVLRVKAQMLVVVAVTPA
jgi:hypothetical protein